MAPKSSNPFKSKNRDRKLNEYSRINSDKTVHIPTFEELGTGRHSNMWLFSTSKTYAVSISSSSSCSTYDPKPSIRIKPDSKRPKSRDRKPNDDSKSQKAPPTFRQLGMGRHSHMWLFDATGWKRIFHPQSCHQSSPYDQ